MMKKFLTNISLFCLVILAIGEIVVRITHAVSDIPQRTIDSYGVQKYIPNQEGYWKGGEHKWIINEYGWPGISPDNYDNLIMVIGDSYIENFMNPNECHQAVFLKEKMKKYNFMEVGRSGISLIEAMEITRQMDTLMPLQSLIYVNDNDFYESVVEIKSMPDITQLSLKENSIVYGIMKAPELKKILYNWKLLYYFYNRFPINFNNQNQDPEKPSEIKIEDNSLKYQQEIISLLSYIITNYDMKDKTLVFHPNSNKTLIKKCLNSGLNVIELDSSKNKTWSFDYDSHWTCYGHQQAADQVMSALVKKLTTIDILKLIN